MDSPKRGLAEIWLALCSHRRWAMAVVATLLFFSGYAHIVSAPLDFKPDTVVRIDYGTPVQIIANDLSEAHIIRYPAVLIAILRLMRAGSIVQTGVYKFHAPENVYRVARRLALGNFGLVPVRITFIEGVTADTASAQVVEALPDISRENFLRLANEQQGYLFPDTYFFQPSANAETIALIMRSNFDKKIEPLANAITRSGHSLDEIVVMASIIEGEASSTIDRYMISGILWNRIRIGMPLQVDVARETYTRTGFPATPINNPGLDALEAAISPTPTKYLYYLTGSDGRMHYATTFADHQANLRKFLN